MVGTVLVTGAQGFLGRHAARWCANHGYTVAGIGHGDWRPEEWKGWGLESWRSASISLASLQLHAGRPDIIFHCAGSGSVGFSAQFPLEDFERTVGTTAHVLEYMRLHSPASRLVYPSSASVYGVAHTLPICESAPTLPVSPYGVHKLMAEQLIVSYARQFALPAAILRLFSVYGKGLRKQLLWDACAKFHAGNATFMGSGNELRDWLHVEDAAALLLTASEFAVPSCPTVNGGTGEGVAVRDILKRLGCALLGDEVTPTFSGAPRTGDPPNFIAGMQGASGWRWRPTHRWQDGVDEYAQWWRAERTRPC